LDALKEDYPNIKVEEELERIKSIVISPEQSSAIIVEDTGVAEMPPEFTDDENFSLSLAGKLPGIDFDL